MGVPYLGSLDRRRQSRGTPMGEPPRRDLETLILGVYRELPGLRLHLTQAARLFGLRVTTCQVVLDDLVRTGHLQRAADGQYGRRAAGAGGC
jgi:hypothetical protein